MSHPKERPHRHHYDAEMLSVEEARERILSYFERLPAEHVPLTEALGQVLAEDMVAGFNIPPLPNSAMDGYAVRKVDVTDASTESPVELEVIRTLAAGALPDRPVVQGTAIRIMTGAPVPDGADAVVPFEDTDELERRKDSGAQSRIGIHLAAEHLENIRDAGEDVQQGETVLSSGQILRSGELGVVASLGFDAVSAFRRPVVAIVSTGDELLQPGRNISPARFTTRTPTASLLWSPSTVVNPESWESPKTRSNHCRRLSTRQWMQTWSLPLLVFPRATMTS